MVVSRKLQVLFLGVFLLLIGACSTKVESLRATKPNILLMMPDDMSYGSLSVYGGEVHTPHLDDLKARGISFENYHVSPSCSPTRAALMTGRNEFYAGVTHTVKLRDRPNPGLRLLPEVLKDKGYATGMFGKWHLGDEKEYQPENRGFEEVFLHGGGGIGNRLPHSADFPGNLYNDPILRHNDRVVQTKGYCTNLFHEQAMKWMKQEKEKGRPFFCYLSVNVMHDPQWVPRDEYLLDPNNTYGSDSNMERRRRILKNYDNNIGRTIKFLEEEGLLENTLVIWFTDNGCSYGMNGTKQVWGGKLSEYDGGWHVPCFMYWKGRLEGGYESDKLVSHIDLYLTLADLAGAEEKAPGTQPWDGRSLLPLLEDPEATWPDRYLITNCGRWKTAEAENAKYIRCAIKDENFALIQHTKLYDLKGDPMQRNDIAGKNPDVVKRLQDTYDDFWEDVRPNLVNEDAELSKPVQPYFDLYRETFGEDAFHKADSSGNAETNAFKLEKKKWYTIPEWRNY